MTAFTPNNELENQLLAAQSGHTAEDDFLQLLMASQVFLPVKSAADGGPNKVEPLTIEIEKDNFSYAVFSSPDRAKEMIAHFPGFESGMLVEYKWVVEQATPDLGVCLNPGLDVGMDMTPDMLQSLPQDSVPAK
ncbi:MAG: SseB family protein [Methylococcales bacterium]|jgi:hypothetical protein|nr:SseB family protein [Methylococcales bacterium]